MPDATQAPLTADEARLTLAYLLRRMRLKSDFPALAASVTRIQAMSDSEHENMQTLCEGILQDVALTQKLLRLVNTAHFRRGGEPISSVARAVALIGMGGVRNLALSLMLLEHMEDKAHAHQLQGEFLRAVMAGTLAAELSRSGPEGELAYMGALFRNLGRLLAFYYLPDDAEQIMALSEKAAPGTPALSLEAAARQVLGMGLDQLGVSVGRMWGLPEDLVSTMLDPGEVVPARSLAARPERSVWLASLANQAADAMLHTEPIELGLALDALSAVYADALDLPPDALADAAGRARQRLSALTSALSLHVAPEDPGARLLDTWYTDSPQHEADIDPTGLVAGPDSALLAPGTPPAAWGMAGSSARAQPVRDPDPPPLPMLPADLDPQALLTARILALAEVLAGPYQLTDVLQAVIETLRQALDCRRVVFCLRDPLSASLQGRLGVGEGSDALKALFRVPLPANASAQADLFGAVCLKNVDTLIADASAPAIVQRLPTWFRDHVQAPTFLLMPLVLQRPPQPDLVLGLLYADRGLPGSLQIDAPTLSLLRTLRNQAIVAFRQQRRGP
ncbi:HDOD domain-containing protein [Aquabacterium sp.]|uniref:HDOD domain-containing protein n=1 Tax=Aquabacterium sp. TaxID=1872578 RepID=UPI0025BD30E1|nr:HDOD domain-containing protein [Aquabacterium sp.]